MHWYCDSERQASDDAYSSSIDVERGPGGLNWLVEQCSKNHTC